MSAFGTLRTLIRRWSMSVIGVKQTSQSLAAWSASDPFRTFNDAAPEVFGAPFLDCLGRLGAS